jgi:hypothetical protein
MGGSMKDRSVQPPHGEGHLLCGQWKVALPQGTDCGLKQV